MGRIGGGGEVWEGKDESDYNKKSREDGRVNFL